MQELRKAYAWKAAQFESTSIVKIISDDGFLINAFQAFVTDKLRHNINKFAWTFDKDTGEKISYDCEWCDKPWGKQEFKDAVMKYEFNYGIRMDCKEY